MCKYLIENQSVDILNKQLSLYDMIKFTYDEDEDCEVVEMLVKKGVDLNFVIDSNDFQKEISALQLACRRKNKRIAKILVENGALEEYRLNPYAYRIHQSLYGDPAPRQLMQLSGLNEVDNKSALIKKYFNEITEIDWTYSHSNKPDIGAINTLVSIKLEEAKKQMKAFWIGKHDEDCIISLLPKELIVKILAKMRWVKPRGRQTSIHSVKEEILTLRHPGRQVQPKMCSSQSSQKDQPQCSCAIL